MSRTLPFWRRKTLEEMTPSEWEALCDGCGKCCLYTLEDLETGGYDPTNVACRLLDCAKGACRNYAKRKKLVPDCIQLTPAKVRRMDYLPETCGYRRVAAGKDLPWWHHLKTGSRETIHEVGMSVRGRVISETEAGPLEHHMVEWVNAPGPARPPKPRR